MLSKIENWFDKDDYKFLISLRNEDASKKALSRLRKFRTMCYLLFMFFVILDLILIILDAIDGQITHPDRNTMAMLLIFVLSINADYQIKMILINQSKSE